MEGKPKPRAVREAQLKGDVAALSRMGQRGAEHAAIKRELRKEKRVEDFKAAEELYRIVDGEILPPESSPE